MAALTVAAGSLASRRVAAWRTYTNQYRKVRIEGKRNEKIDKDHQPRGVEIHSHFGELELNVLEIGESLIELLPHIHIVLR